MMEAGKESRCSDSPLASLVTRLPLSDLLLTGAKPLGFSLEEIVAASHEQLQAAAEAPGLSGPVTPSPICWCSPADGATGRKGLCSLGSTVTGLTTLPRPYYYLLCSIGIVPLLIPQYLLKHKLRGKPKEKPQPIHFIVCLF